MGTFKLACPFLLFLFVSLALCIEDGATYGEEGTWEDDTETTESYDNDEESGGEVEWSSSGNEEYSRTEYREETASEDSDYAEENQEEGEEEAVDGDESESDSNNSGEFESDSNNSGDSDVAEDDGLAEADEDANGDSDDDSNGGDIEASEPEEDVKDSEIGEDDDSQYRKKHVFLSQTEFEELKTEPEKREQFRAIFRWRKISRGLWRLITHVYGYERLPKNHNRALRRCIKLYKKKGKISDEILEKYDEEANKKPKDDDADDDDELSDEGDKAEGNRGSVKVSDIRDDDNSKYKKKRKFVTKNTYEDVKNAPEKRKLFYTYFGIRINKVTKSLFKFIIYCYRHPKIPKNHNKAFKSCVRRYFKSGGGSVSAEIYEDYDQKAPETDEEASDEDTDENGKPEPGHKVNGPDGKPPGSGIGLKPKNPGDRSPSHGTGKNANKGSDDEEYEKRRQFLITVCKSYEDMSKKDHRRLLALFGLKVKSRVMLNFLKFCHRLPERPPNHEQAFQESIKKYFSLREPQEIEKVHLLYETYLGITVQSKGGLSLEPDRDYRRKHKFLVDLTYREACRGQKRRKFKEYFGNEPRQNIRLFLFLKFAHRTPLKPKNHDKAVKACLVKFKNSKNRNILDLAVALYIKNVITVKNSDEHSGGIGKHENKDGDDEEYEKRRQFLITVCKSYEGMSKKDHRQFWILFKFHLKSRIVLNFVKVCHRLPKRPPNHEEAFRESIKEYFRLREPQEIEKVHLMYQIYLRNIKPPTGGLSFESDRDYGAKHQFLVDLDYREACRGQTRRKFVNLFNCEPRKNIRIFLFLKFAYRTPLKPENHDNAVKACLAKFKKSKNPNILDLTVALFVEKVFNVKGKSHGHGPASSHQRGIHNGAGLHHKPDLHALGKYKKHKHH